MALNRNQKTFNTYMHRRIWGQWASLVPIEKTLPYVNEEYKNSCIDLYNFYSDVFYDMYENIELYNLLPNGISENTLKAVQLKKIPEQPFWFFFHVARHSGINENGNMALSTAIYKKKIKKILEKGVLNDLFNKYGIVLSEFPDITVISNTRYPDMFRIIQFMADNEKTKYNLMKCDFRVFHNVKLDEFMRNYWAILCRGRCPQRPAGNSQRKFRLAGR